MLIVPVVPATIPSHLLIPVSIKSKTEKNGMGRNKQQV